MDKKPIINFSKFYSDSKQQSTPKIKIWLWKKGKLKKNL